MPSPGSIPDPRVTFSFPKIVTPVRSVDRMTVGAGSRGPVTEQLQNAFFGLFNGKTEDKWGWLTPVND